MAHSCFAGYLAEGTAPASWGQASFEVTSHLYRVLEANFPELRYCADHWKASYLCTQIYPSWRKNALQKKDKMPLVKSENPNDASSMLSSGTPKRSASIDTNMTDGNEPEPSSKRARTSQLYKGSKIPIVNPLAIQLKQGPTSTTTAPVCSSKVSKQPNSEIEDVEMCNMDVSLADNITVSTPQPGLEPASHPAAHKFCSTSSVPDTDDNVKMTNIMASSSNSVRDVVLDTITSNDDQDSTSGAVANIDAAITANIDMASTTNNNAATAANVDTAITANVDAATAANVDVATAADVNVATAANVNVAAANIDAATAANVNAVTTANVDAATAANIDAATAANVDVVTTANIDATTTANVDATTAANVDAATAANVNVGTASIDVASFHPIAPSLDSSSSPLVTSGLVLAAGAAPPVLTDHQVSALNASTTAPTLTAPKKSRSSGLMKPSKSMSARNLCAIDWVKTNRGGTTADFADYWDRIEKTPEAEPFHQALAAAKKAKKEFHSTTSALFDQLRSPLVDIYVPFVGSAVSFLVNLTWRVEAFANSWKEYQTRPSTSGHGDPTSSLRLATSQLLIKDWPINGEEENVGPDHAIKLWEWLKKEIPEIDDTTNLNPITTAHSTSSQPMYQPGFPQAPAIAFAGNQAGDILFFDYETGKHIVLSKTKAKDARQKLESYPGTIEGGPELAMQLLKNHVGGKKCATHSDLVNWRGKKIPQRHGHLDCGCPKVLALVELFIKKIASPDGLYVREADDLLLNMQALLPEYKHDFSFSPSNLLIIQHALRLVSGLQVEKLLQPKTDRLFDTSKWAVTELEGLVTEGKDKEVLQKILEELAEMEKKYRM
ncbi:hypothetical protein C8R42DRAFT_750394 [Lentinula raphanica]|nr:hypothetical protein C8R42DRAFT_750394 [Lentinula raphanica]